ncbi:hypothetical protein BJ508DRAFT_343623 [Ascobolus immersus RN42]|uniref:F-box domain-containing protein n=1 Tax=Ascobolus immersus RN42 TaxID=1160509 RepID=A0A3N4I9R9_ASCIM|nr:hypothetical protein BJ508DRAFT_343623 [Ascobolus immersus RN42]
MRMFPPKLTQPSPPSSHTNTANTNPDNTTTANTQTDTSPNPHNYHSILDLPTEMRLAIYAHCTALSLLQLTHTSPFLYHDINSCPSLYKKSYGYWHPDHYHVSTSVFAQPDFDAGFGTLNIKLVAQIDWSNEGMFYYNRYGRLRYGEMLQRFFLDSESQSKARITRLRRAWDDVNGVSGNGH